ncbi:hypothetical protein B0H14DRAFT_2637045 [Mycena olivaceomarginata]|nr:hypothetical protein B0H14DRAFT_2637045 [Mycena olivaceomarginata]
MFNVHAKFRIIARPWNPIQQRRADGHGVEFCHGDGGGFSESPPAFQINRYTSHAQTQPILRPNSGSARSIGGGGGVASEFDAMHALNGTLASLDLDRKRDREREREREFAIGERAWSLKSSTVTESTTSAESTSSWGSMQFRMLR